MSNISHFFRTRKITLTDGGVLWEIVTPDGERVASATKEDSMRTLEMDLNLALTDAEEKDTDVVVA